ncbi:hypothetical protein EVJ58_g4999 [Rhodofomes roseus]|uniref:BTB domain-containing protein n=1 Tax=Rhodofomes roseus TaxID=34475 RepID=A0A4Y9YF88_9APHY|nr:hypothetical protein EVJ58_g4999 [Rhodofomes roseus]
MAQPNLEIPCYASSPFNDSDGDLILRSSDGVDFRVFGVILRLASPFFASMLEVGRASHAAADVSHPGGDVVRDGCPVVPVQEDSNTLDLLLRIVYPVKDPVLDDLARLQSVVAAALKYDMEEAIALSSMTLLSFAPQKAFSVWAIAVRNRLEVEARAAADEINRQQISVLENFPPAMQEVNAGSYYRLLQYLSLKGQVGENFELCCPPIIQANSRLAAPSSNASPASNEKVLLYLQGLAVEARQERIRRSESLSDVICRSSDGQEFLAVKAFLAFASPVIAAMVTDTVIPRTRDAGDESVASNANTDLTFEEDGDTLKALIDLCYPDAGDDAQEYLTLPGIHDAVEKYGMKNAREILQRE